ncbi:Fur family transcriptional regulator [Acetobacter sp. DmW_136]|uniref:Fur family transcriptional regulator n=1 Tax=Acetobacter sp. DmW_136 TaxID=2591091 RepID=UPI001239B0EC|nr:Fur family transcriptional regulator [Acetobacter sp. DmW_136]KAA8386416.1 Fur family transcriptional regulator [Acetobacter sp. DmW_136]
MLAFSAYRRSPPALKQIRPGMGASRSAVRRLEERCEDVGIRMTDLRRVLLHGVLEVEPHATVVEIWKALSVMTNGHAPSQGSIQRNLNLLVARDILRRDVTPDRLWRYSVAPEPKVLPSVLFIEVGTGRKIPCNAPEVVILLRRVAAEHGLAVQGASITVIPSVGHDIEAR